MNEEITYRKCKQCEVEKELKEFFPRCLSRSKDYYTYEYTCKRCKLDNANDRRVRLGTEGRSLEGRSVHLRSKYGIDEAEWQAQLITQDNKCAICEKTFESQKHTVVDHCHESGEVRGLLCRQCNTGIGMLGDSKEVLSKAIKYLESNVWERTA